MIQRSAGNRPRPGARRRYEDTERLELEADKDERHVLVDIDGTDAQRERALRTLRSSLLVLGTTLISYHQGWTILLGAGCLAAFSEAPWPIRRR